MHYRGDVVEVLARLLAEMHLTGFQHRLLAAIIREMHGGEAKIRAALPATTSAGQDEVAAVCTGASWSSLWPYADRTFALWPLPFSKRVLYSAPGLPYDFSVLHEERCLRIADTGTLIAEGLAVTLLGVQVATNIVDSDTMPASHRSNAGAAVAAKTVNIHRICVKTDDLQIHPGGVVVPMVLRHTEHFGASTPVSTIQLFAPLAASTGWIRIAHVVIANECQPRGVVQGRTRIVDPMDIAPCPLPITVVLQTGRVKLVAHNTDEEALFPLCLLSRNVVLHQLSDPMLAPAVPILAPIANDEEDVVGAAQQRRDAERVVGARARRRRGRG